MESNPHIKALAELLAGIVLREAKQAAEAAQDAAKNESEQAAKSGDPKCESINVKR